MEGPTLGWFQWMMRNYQLITWPSFLQAIETRFAHSPYKDLTGLLCKLTRKGSVKDYLHQFEALANRIVGLSPSFLMSCFISGLDPEILQEVQAMQPFLLCMSPGLCAFRSKRRRRAQKVKKGN